MGHPHKESNKRRGKKQSQPISNLKQPGCQNPTLGQTTEESKLFSSLMKTEESVLFNSTIVEEDADAAVLTDTTTLLSDDDNWTDTSFDFSDNDASCSNSDVSYISGSMEKQRIVSDISMNSSYEVALAEVLKTLEAMPDLSEPSSELSKNRQYHYSNTTIEPVRAYFEKCGIHEPGRKSYLPLSSNNDLQTWPALTPIKPSFEFSKSRQQHNSNIGVVTDVLKESYVLLGGASYIASSSNSDLEEGNMSFKRSWREVLIGLGTSSEETQTREIKGKSPLHNPDSWVKIVKKGSHTRDSKGKSALHDPDSWVKVVKKGSHMQKLDYPSKDTAKKQHIPMDDYKKYRHNANQHWEIQKSLARNAYASGKRNEWVNLSEQVIGDILGCKPEHHLSWGHCDLPFHVCQGFKSQQPQCVKVRILIWIKLLARMWKEKAEQADEKASQDIFDSRNKNNIVDLMTIDLHGQHVKEGMMRLKYHLAFGVYGRSLRRLRVITGYGSGGTGQSMLKQAVVDLLKTEKFEWEKENEGSLLIKFDMKKRELGFVKL
uniref:Smr domain-containing protein n=1 Tax=Lactuca sativa TaxID=4236 RepID=A0A9R1X281_LACSA|nr:hypothetical protein LSAT_V11C700366670 [Lactuca sativa]